MDGRAMSFGPYRLLAAQRLLLEGDKPVRLGGRAFDILAALVERAGEVIGKEALIARVWPQTFVEEANLKIQVSALRRALGDGQGGHRYIVTVPGRGYNFVAPIRLEQPSPPARPAEVVPAKGNNLPLAVTRAIGRDEVVATVVARLSRQRLVTVVGPGGIGKTTVGLAVAERLIADYEHGLWLADLAPLRDPGLVPSAVATALGLEIRTENPLPALVAALRDKRMLLMLDNCEHVIDAAAGLAAAVLSGTSYVKILATSREPLGVQGEHVHRLGPLGSPEPSPTLAAAEAAAFPAVQLFVERVTAIVEDFALTDANAPLVVAICRRLDGLPLAIEFAAPRVEVLGIEGLAAGLADSLRLLGTQRRAAVPRHRTMQAVVDWSYGLLSEDEQRFFRALGIFAGAFTAEAAAAVAMDAATSGADPIDRMADLVAKSLVVADVSGTRPRFRLLDTTRAYAIEKLDESGNREQIARCHAEYYRNLFERAEDKAGARFTGEWLAEYAQEIDNLRAALDWAFSPDGDAALGVSLAAVAMDFWIATSLVSECCDWGLNALAQLGAAEGTRAEMMLQCGLGQALSYSRGMQRDAKAALTRALTLSEAMADYNYQVRAIFGLWRFAIFVMDFRECLALCNKCELLGATTGNATASFAADCTFGVTRSYLGEHTAAAAHLKRALSTYLMAMRSGDPIRYGTDLVSLMLGFQARTFWFLGFAERACRAGRDAIREARGVDSPVALCVALAAVGGIHLVKMGYLEDAEHCIEELIDHSGKHSLHPYHAFGLCAKGGLTAARGEMAEAERLLRTGLQRLRVVAYLPLVAYFQGELAAVLASSGRIDEALVEIDDALRSAEESESLWCMPELMRIKGDVLLLSDPVDTIAAEKQFGLSLDLAHKQGALSSELRAATSLARLQRDRGRPREAREILAGVYGRFTEGFGTADLIAAKQLLDELGTPDHD